MTPHASHPASAAQLRQRTPADYPVQRTVPTRWADNDRYGHLNNVVYYGLFDTVVNAWLVEQGALDIEAGAVVGYVVHSHCDYFRPLAYPEPVRIALGVRRIGRSSVVYEVAAFGAQGPEADRCAAAGEFVHSYVDRASGRPVTELPATLAAAVTPLLRPLVV